METVMRMMQMTNQPTEPGAVDRRLTRRNLTNVKSGAKKV